VPDEPVALRRRCIAHLPHQRLPVPLLVVAGVKDAQQQARGKQPRAQPRAGQPALRGGRALGCCGGTRTSSTGCGGRRLAGRRRLVVVVLRAVGRQRLRRVCLGRPARQRSSGGTASAPARRRAGAPSTAAQGRRQRAARAAHLAAGPPLASATEPSMPIQ
jgi:hypothetical protein